MSSAFTPASGFDILSTLLKEALLAGLVGSMFACSTNAPNPTPNVQLSDQHLSPSAQVAGAVPNFALVPPLPPPPRPSARLDVYSVTMNKVNVQDLLFALARDAKLNIDIHPGITGSVTMNVHDQTLPEILDRVARQVDLRYDIQGKNLSIQPDLPYLKHYRVDYPNIQRDSTGSITTTANIGGGGNTSSNSISNIANNHFWATLIDNVKQLLSESDRIITAAKPDTVAPPAAEPAAPTPKELKKNTAPALAIDASTALTQPPRSNAPTARNSFREAASVFANQESGTISVRATQSQHAKVRDLLSLVLDSARRQVLIEATIVEVDLSSQYQQGINWSLFQKKGSNAGTGILIQPSGDATTLRTGGAVGALASLTFKQTGLWNGAADLTAMLTLLESFGNLKVLSSPKISVLNNQSSVLKVVDSKIYFTIDYTPGVAATTVTPATPAVYTTTSHATPIGFVMTVVPQISESGEVTLSLRPTITRITGYVADPNPILAQNNVINKFPEVQTREMESVMRVQSGDIAILGGLMQDTRSNYSDEVPGMNRVPMVGDLFKYRNESKSKSELVIFIRPTVLKVANLDADLKSFRGLLNASTEALNSNGPDSSNPAAALQQ